MTRHRQPFPASQPGDPYLREVVVPRGGNLGWRWYLVMHDGSVWRLGDAPTKELAVRTAAAQAVARTYVGDWRLTAAEAADLLHVSVKTIRAWRHRKRLPAPILDPDGVQVWTVRDLLRAEEVARTSGTIRHTPTLPGAGTPQGTNVKEFLVDLDRKTALDRLMWEEEARTAELARRPRKAS